jgi:hypothetical protein
LDQGHYGALADYMLIRGIDKTNLYFDFFRFPSFLAQVRACKIAAEWSGDSGAGDDMVVRGEKKKITFFFSGTEL